MIEPRSGQHRPDCLDPQPRWTLDPCARHLNHGSFGAVPEAVQAEQARLRRLMEWNPVRWFASVADRIADARLQMAEILGADPGRLVFVGNASAGASVVYQALAGREPVDVLVTNHGYGSVTMGAQRLARRTGGRCRIARIPLDASRDEVIGIVAADLDRHRPTLLVIDQITSATARAFPADEICAVARDRGVSTMVDGAHAPGSVADPVCREADYWVANLHKFACAARGAAIVIARGDGQELFPLIDSWGSPLEFPRRFDHTGTMDVTAWLTAPFAWRHIDETIGWDQVRQRSKRVLDAGSAVVADALGGLVADPLPDVGQPVGAMRLLRLPGSLGATQADADALRIPFGDATGLNCAFTTFEGQGYLRLSAHVYNSIHDYEHLAAVGVPVLQRWALDRSRSELVTRESSSKED